MARPISMRIPKGKCAAWGLEKWSMLGHRVVDVDNLEGSDEPADWGKAAILDPNFPKLPPQVWNATIKLYIRFMEGDDTKEIIANQRKVDSGLEVAVFYTINLTTEVVSVWVPTQAISGASVEIDYEQPIINLLTGEVLDGGVHDFPDDEVKIGTSHSHNTMWAGFSGIDDANELDQPGMHIVAGRFSKDKDSGLWNHEIATSVVMGGARYRKVLVPDTENPGNQVVRDMSVNDIMDYDHTVAVEPKIEEALALITIDRGSFTVTNPKSHNFKLLGEGMSHSDQEEWDYYMGHGRYSHGYTRYSGGYGSSSYDCEINGCDGTYSYSGYCWECHEYSPENDDRSAREKFQHEHAEPVYGMEGKLIGYRVPTNAELTSYSYYYTDSIEFKRLIVRHGWKETGSPGDGLSKSQRKKIEKRDKKKGRQRKLSSHSAIGDDKVIDLINQVLKVNHVMVANDAQESVLKYELKEFTKVMLYMEMQDDKRGVLMECLRDIFREVTGDSIRTSEEEAEMHNNVIELVHEDYHADLDEVLNA